VRGVRPRLLGEPARLLAVVEAQDGAPAADAAEEVVEPVERGDGAANVLELDGDDVPGWQLDHTYSSTCA
jgi:hypothetical protein